MIRSRRQTFRKKGVVRVDRPILNFMGPDHISGKSEARVVIFCAQVGDVKL